METSDDVQTNERARERESERCDYGGTTVDTYELGGRQLDGYVEMVALRLRCLEPSSAALAAASSFLRDDLLLLLRSLVAPSARAPSQSSFGFLLRRGRFSSLVFLSLSLSLSLLLEEEEDFLPSRDLLDFFLREDEPLASGSLDVRETAAPSGGCSVLPFLSSSSPSSSSVRGRGTNLASGLTSNAALSEKVLSSSCFLRMKAVTGEATLTRLLSSCVSFFERSQRSISGVASVLID